MNETVKVKPIHAPVKCVVCNGYGTVTKERRVCHGCGGKGYILVDAEELTEDPNKI